PTATPRRWRRLWRPRGRGSTRTSRRTAWSSTAATAGSPTPTPERASPVGSGWRPNTTSPEWPCGDSASRTRRCGRSSRPRRRDPDRGGGGSALRSAPRLVEVGEIHGVDHLADDGQLLVGDVLVLLVPALLLLGLGEHPRLVEDLAGDVDLGADPHRDRDGVRGTGVDVQLTPVALGEDARVEDVVAQRGDDDAFDHDLGGAEHVDQEVVGDRALGGDAGDPQRDRIGLVDPDPDRQ